MLFRSVKVCDPFNLKEFEQIVKEEVAQDELSVIIAQRPCALLKNVKFGPILQINQDKCTKCRMCMKLGCPAIVDKGDHIEINPTQCVGCGLCPRVCRFDAIEKAGGQND